MSDYVKIPVAVLLDPELTAAAKLLQVVNSRGLAGDATAFGLSRQTVRRHSAIPRSPTGGPRVGIPRALLTSPELSAQAKVLYGVLQHTPGFRWPAGRFTYVELRRLTGHSIATLKLAVAALAGAGWLEVSQTGLRGPVAFTLGNPEVAQRQYEYALVKQRIAMAPLDRKGETLMREYLSQLVDSSEYDDDAVPGWLVNPFTNVQMHLDRYYIKLGVAWEFNGPQHYVKTPRFGAETVARQRARDHMKAGLCADQGVRLIVVHAEDLTLEAMSQKVGDLLPRRSLEGAGAILSLLRDKADGYREKARRGSFGPEPEARRAGQ